MTQNHAWPNYWFTHPKTLSRRSHKPNLTQYLSKLRKTSLRTQADALPYSHENLRQIEQNPVRQLSGPNALILAHAYKQDPLELMLKDGEAPAELLYWLGWVIFPQFKEFLEQQLIDM